VSVRVIGVLLVVLATGTTALAQNPGEIAQRARALAAGAGSIDSDVQTKAIADLGKLSVAFMQAADAATLRGGSGSDELRAAYEAIHAPLARVQSVNAESMEAGVRKVIEADGDLEALYDSPAYLQSQQVGASALYYLNWLRYYGARLQSGDARKRLLGQARDGFAEFAGDPSSELGVESLLGRGLCELDLGDLRAATEDLSAVSKAANASAERKQKARLSLLEAHVRAGNAKAALRQSDELLQDGNAEAANWVRFMRLRALVDAAAKGGAEAPGYRSEALVLMDRLRRAGGGWDQQVAALAQSAFADADAWKASASTPFAKWELAKLYVQKRDYEGATPLLEAVLASDDKTLAAHRGQAHYFLGLARFKAGDYAGAVASLAAAAEGSDGSDGSVGSVRLQASDKADAAYLLFKAHEALATAAGAEADLAPLEAAARALVASHPKHAAAFEARFRIAELSQLRGEFAAAIALYAEVKGDPAFELQAAFATAQCRFELYKLAATADERATVLAAVGADLDAFAARIAKTSAKDGASLPLEAMGAKAAVMRAVARKLQAEPDHAGVVAALDDFEAQYPGQAELLAQVARLRLEALRELGEFAAARAVVEGHGDALLAELGAAAMEEIAVTFIRAGARRSGEGDKSANEAAQRVALAVYERLGGADEVGTRTKLTLARLHENTGDLDAAAALYGEALAGEKVSLAALRGLARIAEAQQRLDDALGYWRRLGEAARPGDLPWYESSYEQARVTELRGDKAAACEILEKLRPAMPGLGDQDLRAKLTEIYDRACG